MVKNRNTSAHHSRKPNEATWILFYLRFPQIFCRMNSTIENLSWRFQWWQCLMYFMNFRCIITTLKLLIFWSIDSYCKFHENVNSMRMMSPLKRHSNPVFCECDWIFILINCWKIIISKVRKRTFWEKKSFLWKKTDYKVRKAAFPCTMYSHATYVNYVTCSSDKSFEYPFANGLAVMYKLHIARTNRVEKFKIFPWHNT